MSKTSLSHLALLLAGIIFGANYWIAKGLMPDFMNPEQIVFVRAAVSAIIFLLIYFVFVREKVDPRDYFLLALSGLLGMSINQYFFFMGLELSTPIDTSIIHVFCPVITFVFAGIIIRERITPLRTFGIGLGVIGAVLLITGGALPSFASDTFRGNLLVLVNITAYALYLVMVKPLMKKYNPITIMTWFFVSGFIFLLPVTGGEMLSMDWPAMTAEAWQMLFYVVILSTVIAYLLTVYALVHLSASLVGFYIYLQPLVSAGIAISIGDESLTPIKVFAALLIFAGVFFVNRKVVRTGIKETAAD
jgi:drug/metabolite transporter (DMT)-like permease